MPTMKIELSLDGDAMEQNFADEVATTLGRLIVSVLQDPEWNHANLRDTNGNTIGQAWIEED